MGSVGEEIRLFAGWLCIRILILIVRKFYILGKWGFHQAGVGVRRGKWFQCVCVCVFVWY